MRRLLRTAALFAVVTVGLAYALTIPILNAAVFAAVLWLLPAAPAPRGVWR